MGQKMLKNKKVALWEDPELAFPGVEKVEIAKLSGEVVEIQEVKAMEYEDSEKQEKRVYYLCLADWDGREVVFSTGVFMTRQLKRYIDAGGEFPTRVKIEKVQGKRYYRFSEP